MSIAAGSNSNYNFYPFPLSQTQQAEIISFSMKVKIDIGFPIPFKLKCCKYESIDKGSRNGLCAPHWTICGATRVTNDTANPLGNIENCWNRPLKGRLEGNCLTPTFAVPAGWIKRLFLSIKLDLGTSRKFPHWCISASPPIYSVITPAHKYYYAINLYSHVMKLAVSTCFSSFALS